MALSDIPLFAMLRGRLGHLSERQRVIAANVANSDTPGFAPKDLQPFRFQAALQGSAALPALTHPAHMLPAKARNGANAGARPVISRDSETTLDGNSVVLEEQMIKMSEARMNYDAAIGFYQKSLNLLRLASRAPGR